MKRLCLCVLFVSALVGVGCASDPLHVALFDASGTLVLEGELRLDVGWRAADGSRPVRGTWHLEGAGALPDPAEISGRVWGSQHGERIGFTLETDASDSGFSLQGTRSPDRIEGTWSAITIAGEVPGGTFGAVRAAR